MDMEMEPRIFDECSDYVGFYEELTSCPPGWTELSDQNCVKVETDQRNDWITAQRRCLEQQSNLVMFNSNEKVNELESKCDEWFQCNHVKSLADLFKTIPTKLWVGNNDAVTEGKLVDLENKDALHLSRSGSTSSSLIDNNEDNDCMFLQFGDNEQFRMDSCASFNGYICEMKKDGTSTLYNPLVQEIQEGSNSRTSEYTIWLLMFLIGILFLTITAFLCFICWKQKDGNRVHTEGANIQQNAFMSETSQRVERSRGSTGGQNSVTVANDVNRPTRSSQVAVTIENNRPPPKKFPVAPVPNRLPMSEENSGSEPVVETGILTSDNKADDDDDVETVSAAPKPQPRTLPPIPTREGTLNSMNTRDGSTHRTQRRKELFERPVMNVLDNVSAISLDEFWSNKKNP
uniref:C-type lectin domain-containing protein n=1 Tax=Caenorhabditis tropicalis TaxID=1561998 RepID=A0A1I7TCN3_9PELO